jgi:F-type H+-transporting ATPase subunit delta
VEVFVPRELSTEQYMKLLNTFNALADKEVELEITVQPDLVAGIKARVGDIVLDNTVKAHLEEMREAVDQKLETLVAPDHD